MRRRRYTQEFSPPKVDKPELLRRFRAKADLIEDTIRKTGKIDELNIYAVLIDAYRSPDMANLLEAKGFSIADTMPAHIPPAPDDDKVLDWLDGSTPVGSRLVSATRIATMVNGVIGPILWKAITNPQQEQPPPKVESSEDELMKQLQDSRGIQRPTL